PRAPGAQTPRGPEFPASTTSRSSSARLVCHAVPRRERPDGQGMDPLAGNVAQRPIDHALAFQPSLASEGHALDHDGEVRFAAAIVAHVAAVAPTVVDHV